ncbi:tumor protein p63-regulated gene 1-like protein isoform X1 [Hyla sarda]|uniref:tumor protein p63-regulated gene 1-like protein isoform X1 n=1 Tax=Hyla sarda TaxID=327740 RepID=UPI0024C3BAD0|nr:tumor protein p63-regulated gene 1-like protein isoform X1 [Hyla sarda]
MTVKSSCGHFPKRRTIFIICAFWQTGSIKWRIDLTQATDSFHVEATFSLWLKAAKAKPTVVEQAIQDIRNYLSPDEDGNLRSSWILSQISHWGTEREVIAFLCDQSLLICYYDFVELGRSHVFRIPLNYIDTVTWGPLSYPKMAVNKLEGKVIQIKWDKFREPPSFLSWWNPWTEDLSYINLIQHPGNPPEKHLRDMCELETFMEKLVEMVKVAHERNPLPGRANGLLVLQRPVTIDTSLGLVSLLNHKVQLGYAKSRWRFGF